MQKGSPGALVGRFDQGSLVRSLDWEGAGEIVLAGFDLH